MILDHHPHSMANDSKKPIAPKCHLLDLPPELRLNIYAHLLAKTTVHFRYIDGVLCKTPFNGSRVSAIAVITGTCHRIRSGSTPLLWDLATIDTTVSDELDIQRVNKHSHPSQLKNREILLDLTRNLALTMCLGEMNEHSLGWKMRVCASSASLVGCKLTTARSGAHRSGLEVVKSGSRPTFCTDCA